MCHMMLIFNQKLCKNWISQGQATTKYGLTYELKESMAKVRTSTIAYPLSISASFLMRTTSPLLKTQNYYST